MSDKKEFTVHIGRAMVTMLAVAPEGQISEELRESASAFMQEDHTAIEYFEFIQKFVDAGSESSPSVKKLCNVEEHYQVN